MFLMDGEPIAADTPFEKDGVQYPANWITFATVEEREAIGITEVADPPPYNYRFYISEGVPRPIEDIQAMFTSEIKATAQAEILRMHPDWHQRNVSSRGVELTYISAERELTPEEAAEVENFKVVWSEIKALREHSNALEGEMMGRTFEELTTWQQHGWPPSDVAPL